MLIVPLVCVIINILTNVNSQESECNININEDLPPNEPLLFVKDGSEYNFVRPNEDGVVSISNGGELIFSCSKNNFDDSSLSHLSSLKARCSEYNQFNIEGDLYEVSELECDSKVNPTLTILNESCADGKGQVIDVGFDILLETTSSHKTLIQVCFNSDVSTTYYSEHTVLGEGLKGSQNDGSRPSFKVGIKSLYPFSPDAAYKKSEQLVTLTNILGSSGAAQDILDQTYLARGHLAPDADFIYLPLQDSTYFYFNAAPQWQSFNSGSWLTLENSIRDLAKSTNLDYIVITGTHGALTIPDVNNNDQEIDLFGYGSVNGSPKLPVPQFYWKILKEPKSEEGIAFVGLNSYKDDELVNWPCSDICSKNGWGSPSWENSIICCTVQDFKESVEDSPDVFVSGILQGIRKKSWWRGIWDLFANMG